MRQPMASFVAKLTFHEMCVVLREQRRWRQAHDFFAWMKLQLNRIVTLSPLPREVLDPCRYAMNQAL